MIEITNQLVTDHLQTLKEQLRIEDELPLLFSFPKEKIQSLLKHDHNPVLLHALNGNEWLNRFKDKLLARRIPTREVNKIATQMKKRSKEFFEGLRYELEIIEPCRGVCEELGDSEPCNNKELDKFRREAIESLKDLT